MDDPIMAQRHASCHWPSFVCARINGARVEETYTSQIWTVRIATGIAFLVKTLFVISAGIAYTQYQWLTTRSKTFKIRQIDAISSVLTNPLAFCETRAWARFPALSLLAGITWSVYESFLLRFTLTLVVEGYFLLQQLLHRQR
jgi:hypothetical protein